MRGLLFVFALVCCLCAEALAGEACEVCTPESCPSVAQACNSASGGEVVRSRRKPFKLLGTKIRQGSFRLLDAATPRRSRDRSCKCN